MGLFIAKTLTEAQNGRIWVDTELGVGSTYNVLIPISSEEPG
jgi:signal transduction histidine kinase